ncbi:MULTISPECIES: helix-turn-helix domain-containing protein [Pasteurellaceae]|uniref:Helix-turn-helix transcriptional regulator n=2 Tax=Pasteurellaceae TaxID=712 RepID=A0AAW8CH87_9PAST|nr:helix-turn-helix transcriptional regulator [Pasteurella atlantica]MDP8039339.1 helix-turn-helix transcriptional regulator [Pasteurella atlantica]MDP8041431.1 helix-turn-helix transcriptional regulator [Pasteurella atlantica]MDP8043644.1 helix-turn-helix transcriptional regulator [Pasteurella atlantica]MDP8045652.1 helix-turn-helix transcriptional regulator [Pasteurella atlantica]MDP8061507.1 helix-turn-helix transcriptional regulator [Pasteurella atlantica]
MFNKKKSPILFPKYKEPLLQLGENIKLASKRRKFTQLMLSERTGLSRMTIRKIVNGDPTVAIGYYIMVLGVLGLEQDIRNVGLDDELGRKLQDIELLRK